MLNRRHLRIKVLQILYAFHQSEKKDTAAFEKQLLKNITQVYDEYLYILLLLVEVAEYAEEAARERAAKLKPSQEDLNASTRLASNAFTVLLRSDEAFNKQVSSRKISLAGDSGLVRQLFREVSRTGEYAAYCGTEESSYESDRALMDVVFRKVFTKSTLLEQTLEERDLSWPVNKEIVRSMVKRTLKTYEPEKASLMPVSQNWPDDKEFVVTLFRKTVEFDTELQEYIELKARNWDVERIALMDILLMKLTLCELLKFPDIPVKVSINEYIELSKEYSTPKSRIFINGILDKILVDFKKENKIVKTGRGLIE